MNKIKINKRTMRKIKIRRPAERKIKRKPSSKKVGALNKELIKKKKEKFRLEMMNFLKEIKESDNNISISSN
jgi:hypothetical protein